MRARACFETLLDLLQSKGLILYLGSDDEGDFLSLTVEPGINSVEVELLEMIEENKLLLREQITERGKRAN